MVQICALVYLAQILDISSKKRVEMSFQNMLHQFLQKYKLKSSILSLEKEKKIFLLITDLGGLYISLQQGQYILTSSKPTLSLKPI